jgi:hypothetical protein
MEYQISITRALTEIKHLKDRIQRAINNPTFVGVVIGKDQYARMATGTKSVTDFKDQAKSDYHTVADMIRRRDELKRAVIKSNSETNVNIGGVTMSVAEAIEMKSSIAFKEALVNKLRHDLQVAKAFVDKTNEKVNADIEAAVTAAYGNEKGKVDVDQYQAVANPRLQRQDATLADAIDVETVIAKLQNEIEVFQQEVDFILSESNSRTSITV